MENRENRSSIICHSNYFIVSSSIVILEVFKVAQAEVKRGKTVKLPSFEEFKEKHEKWVSKITFPQKKDVVGIMFWSKFSKDPQYKVMRILLQNDSEEAYKKIMSNRKYRKLCFKILGL